MDQKETESGVSGVVVTLQHRVREALNDGHLNICCEVERVKNLLLTCEHAATYAEEQRSALHEPPSWELLFNLLGEFVQGIIKRTDELYESVMVATGENRPKDQVHPDAAQRGESACPCQEIEKYRIREAQILEVVNRNCNSTQKEEVHENDTAINA
jgi:hypothetical protein